MLGAGYNKDEDKVEELINKRTDIINCVLNEEITLNEAKKRLKEIETGKLYSDDIDSIVSAMNTDQEKIIGMRIVSTVKKHHVADIICYETVIQWQYYGNVGNSSEVCHYNVGVKEDDKERKLVSFELIE